MTPDAGAVSRGHQLSSKPLATVVVPMYQDESTIGRCLSSLEGQTLRDSIEIVVVDDGSRDNGPAIAAAFPVRVIRQANAGPAAARNAGAALARADLLVFLDADCDVGPEWIANLICCFEDSSVVAAFCPLQASTQGIVPRIVQAELDDRYARLRSREIDNDFIAAAACAVRVSSFGHIGGFNELFRANEDVELAFQLRAAGGRIAVAWNAPARHAHQTSWRDLVRAKFLRGIWRMRLYSVFPEKRLADSWTPGSLKVQIVAALMLAPLLLLSIAVPTLLVVAALLIGVIFASAWQLLWTTATSLRPVAGFAAPVYAGAWILVRAAVLAAAVVYYHAVPWRPAGRRHKTGTLPADPSMMP